LYGNTYENDGSYDMQLKDRVHVSFGSWSQKSYTLSKNTLRLLSSQIRVDGGMCENPGGRHPCRRP